MGKKKINWEEIIQEQKSSGKSIKDFCKAKRIHQNTFYLNRKKLGYSGFVKISLVKEKTETRSGTITIRYKELSIILEPDSNPESVKNLLIVLGII